MDITVAGIGYVGLITAVCLADKGHNVICVDVDETKINRLRAGEAIIFEEDLAETLQRNKSRLTFTTDTALAYKQAKVIFVGVGTPENEDGTADLCYVKAVIRDIAEQSEGEHVTVVIKSTVPIGTNEQIQTFLSDKVRPGVKVAVVSNPEFLSQGTAIRNTLKASRIVIGANDQGSRDLLLEVYKDFEAPKVVTDIASAEMIKYASNNFLAVKISFVNEIANLCEVVGADIGEVTHGMSYDPRIGEQFLNAGIGYGGSCFPKDTKALYWISRYYDRELQLVKAALEINEKQRMILLDKAKKHIDSFAGLTVAVLGLTFKPRTNDLREAPSLYNIRYLLDAGAKIKAYDPVGIPACREIFRDSIEYFDNIDDTIRGADICFVFTEWEEIVNYDVNKFGQLMRRPLIMDGRRCIKQPDNCHIIVETVGTQPSPVHF